MEKARDFNPINLTSKTNGFSKLERLQKRQTIISTIREDFYSEGFLEVETPLLVKKTVPDTYIDSIAAQEGFLITSTEYQIKRLLAAGLTKAFTLTKNFRAQDRGQYHRPEFTMLEWARTSNTLEQIEEDAMRFILKAFHKLFPHQECVSFNGNQIEFISGSWTRLTVRQAFETYLGLTHLENFSLDALIQASKKANIVLPQDFQKDKSLAISFLLDLLQPYLGKKRPTFLYEWPTYLTSSAPHSSIDPYVAERSELYIGGIEIANGFPFLRNPDIQRQLFEEQLKKRKEIGKPCVELDEKYITSLGSLPAGAGMALGVDRLVMILTDAKTIGDVQAFDWEEL